ncbi:HDA3 [Candida pseudojiufengensis]|uniref:HDA3 n=1 Tax=Candida pseudojiufengensis TaxID=497109 RepID=UPI0022243A9F|nr:HDA3 [Candida pseudojiufengensis]KAI5961898.1 HDA3 [Candida pseudojiufengensis]
MNLLKILDTTPEPPIIELELNELNHSGDYNLGCPMYEYQKELTDQIISLHYPDILKFCEINDFKDIIIKSVETCIENCMLVSTHPYLLISHYMPKNLAQKDMPAKIAETSGKFNVLKDLLNVIILSSTTKEKSIGLVMSNNIKLFDLIEALILLCSGNKVIRRYVGNNIQRESKKQSKMNGNGNGNGTSNGTDHSAPTYIHLIPSDGNIQRDKDLYEQAKFDVLITIDGGVDTQSEFYQSLKTKNHNSDEKPAVNIRLIPLKTVEHVKLHYENHKTLPDYLYKLISSVVCLRDYIGNLSPDVFPIYNQKLNYLRDTFFNILFENSTTYPSWPLPSLPIIQQYTPIDVERSLLTEAHFHYTPYGLNGFSEEKKVLPTYYEIKRLQSDYITNPLKNSYNELIGIIGSNDTDVNNGVLTHKMLLQLNSAFLELNRIEEELQSYENYESEEVQNRIGRREKEMRLSVSKIFDDIDHAQQRIESGNKWIVKKIEKIDNLKNEIKEKKEKLSTMESTVTDENQKKYIKNQLEIWNLQNEIKLSLNRILSKNDEKNYTTKEYQNALNSIKESEVEYIQIEKDIETAKRKLEDIENDQEEQNKEFELKQNSIIQQINETKSSNEEIEKKLNTAFKFLRDTSHLKKRKIRTATPNK